MASASCRHREARVKKYLLTYGILALSGVCNLRRVGTHVFVSCRVEIGFTVCEICKYISFFKNVLKAFSCFSFVSRAQYFVTLAYRRVENCYVKLKIATKCCFYVSIDAL